MAAPSSGGPEWQDDGFPPRSFPEEVRGQSDDGPRTRARPGPALPAGPEGRTRWGGRGRWLAAAALVALVVLIAGLLAATQGDDDPDLAVGGTSTTTTTEVVATTVPLVASSTSLATTSTVASTSTTAAAEATSTTAGAGVLETSLASVAVPKVNAADGPQSARLTLRNRGPGPLTYTTQSSSVALTASPARATIAAGGTVELTVTIEGTRVTAEGPFTATLDIGGNGGAKSVMVTSTVGRAPIITDTAGERCADPAQPCSRQIRLEPSTRPDASPCNTPWAYAVAVTDQSQVQSVKVTARKGLANADAALLSAGQPGGPSGTFSSAPMEPLPTGLTLRFVVEATDQYAFATRLAQETVTC